MLFNTVLFAAFFIAFFAVFEFVTRSRVQKLWCITVASVIFYAVSDYRFVPLLLGTALLDFYIAREIQRHDSNEPLRKRLLVFSIVANLSVLAIFKYADFGVSSAFGLLAALGVNMKAPVFDIALPAGISFYTFQSMSYTIDVYRRELQARERPIEFLAGVTFFPHLVAGPIIRASTLLPQFEKIAPRSWSSVQKAFLLIGTGLLNKTIADHLAEPAAQAFSKEASFSSLECWTGVLAFAGQVYGDFAGYTDIAIGVALLLGFVVPINFNLPYIATSPSDFWRRWHISLSTWLRDYLYLPMCGESGRVYTALFLTMLLGGVWHGAKWTFVAWGAYHGLLLVLEHVASSRLPDGRMPGPAWAVTTAQRVFTFYLVLIGLALFRSDTISQAWTIVRGMHVASVPSVWTYNATLTLGLVVAALPVMHLASYASQRIGERVEREGTTSGWMVWPMVVNYLAIAMVFSKGNAFIYFQF
ncbi:MAG: MBOAT family O-acyltransferase [Myxococcaceae bacterium]